MFDEMASWFRSKANQAGGSESAPRSSIPWSKVVQNQAAGSDALSRVQRRYPVETAAYGCSEQLMGQYGNGVPDGMTEEMMQMLYLLCVTAGTDRALADRVQSCLEKTPEKCQPVVQEMSNSVHQKVQGVSKFRPSVSESQALQTCMDIPDDEERMDCMMTHICPAAVEPLESCLNSNQGSVSKCTRPASDALECWSTFIVRSSLAAQMEGPPEQQ